MGDRASGFAAVASRNDHIQRTTRTNGNERVRTSSGRSIDNDWDNLVNAVNIAPFLTQNYDQHAAVSTTSH